MTQSPASPNLQPQRMPELMTRDREELDRLLSETILAHVGRNIDGRATVMPTAFVVMDDTIIIHGSTGSRWMRANSRKVLAATLLLEMPISDWSLRVSEGWAEDDERDVAGDAWGGVIRLSPQLAMAVSAPDLRDGIAVSPSVAAFVAAPHGIVYTPGVWAALPGVEAGRMGVN